MAYPSVPCYYRNTEAMADAANARFFHCYYTILCQKNIRIISFQTLSVFVLSAEAAFVKEYVRVKIGSEKYER